MQSLYMCLGVIWGTLVNIDFLFKINVRSWAELYPWAHSWHSMNILHCRHLACLVNRKYPTSFPGRSMNKKPKNCKRQQGYSLCFIMLKKFNEVRLDLFFFDHYHVAMSHIRDVFAPTQQRHVEIMRGYRIITDLECNNI